ncbi:gamma-glutamyltransferase family protein [Aquimonas voraii]|uniref:Gamma-glutamyltranspeptidase / glutathione hydrolase n=1 Tax=Aquimonas voraii TaxID=265719 RepID=A0A1G6U9A8_9GAMM|nr:gamma-glutamyltransferase family protein [Aquimonas voraii]SDD37879.1 gamma-glutamyltranspeptidase / glutathione hydrolase [Aquimonas voraii]
MIFASGRFMLLACLPLLLLAGCAQPPPRAQSLPSQAPLREAMVAAADPLAVDAGLEILREGGSAVDSAIAVAMTLGLVEPESSGVGGGGLLVHYRARDRAIEAYDGREWAPAGAQPDMFLQANGAPMPFEVAQASGLSIGTPSLVAMLAMAHEAHGRLPWSRLMQPAIRLSEDGFVIGPRLARSLQTYRAAIAADPQARAIYLHEKGQPWPQGHRLRNPEYARSLRAIAEQGPRALTHGRIADEIIAAAQRAPRAGSLSLDDLAAFAPRRLEPLCAPFRAYRVCSVPSPSSANAMLSILGLYARARPAPDGPQNIDDWAAFVWASRLSYVDRDHYMADERFVEAPTAALVASDYLDARAALIDLRASRDAIPIGAPAGEALRQRWGSSAMQENGTTHLSIVDADGNAVALTATIESEYGAQRMAGGFWLNNQLTDFSFEPVIDGKPVANAVAPRKAPRSSMSPSIVTDADGRLVLVTGSMGGSTIIASVARSIIGVLDWNLSPQQALATPALFARTRTIEAERGRLPNAILEGLRQLGWNVVEADLYSGTHLIEVTPQGLEGGADPRLEGRAARVLLARR